MPTPEQIASIRRLPAGEAQDMIEMVHELTADHAAQGCCSADAPCVHLARALNILPIYQQVANPAGPRLADVSPQRDPEAHRPAGGSRGANQYGAYTVRMPSDKQIRFVAALLSSRVVPTTGGEQVALAAYRAGRANLRQTSDLISWLLTLPEAEVDDFSGAPVRPASPKQIAFLGSLLQDRNIDAADPAMRTVLDLVANGTLIESRDASAAIEWLKAQPKIDSRRAQPLEAGIYQDPYDLAIYKVYTNQARDRMLCKMLVHPNPDPLNHSEVGERWTFKYMGLASRFVQADWRMTLEQAKQFGAIYGVCCNCGATLTDETSIEAGIGPVCAKRFT